MLAQLVGSGRGALGSYNAEASDALMKHLQDVPIKDGDAWIQMLMSKNEMLGTAPSVHITKVLHSLFIIHRFTTLCVCRRREDNGGQNSLCTG